MLVLFLIYAHYSICKMFHLWTESLEEVDSELKFEFIRFIGVTWGITARGKGKVNCDAGQQVLADPTGSSGAGGGGPDLCTSAGTSDWRGCPEGWTP